MNVIIMDLDGTLLDNNGKVLEDTKKYLINRKILGDKLVISSGRSYLSASCALEDFANYIDYFILQNGAQIVDSKGNTLAESKLSVEKVKEMYELFELEKNVSMLFFSEDKVNCLINREVCEAISKDKSMPKVDFRIDDLTEDVYKILFLAEHNNLMYVKDILTSHEFNACFSSPTFLEVNANSVSKGSGVKELLKMLNDVDHVYIFGDNDNDVSMLILDYETVAMKNSSVLARDVAKYVSKYDNNNDGIMRFLIEEFDSLKEEKSLDSLGDDILANFGEE